MANAPEPASPRIGGAAERAWWSRAVLVLFHPRPVFAAFRDEAEAAADARQEPVTAIVFLAGIAVLLAGGTAGTLLDDNEFDHWLVPFWLLFGGGLQAVGLHWLGGLLLYAGARGLGGAGSYRDARHLLAFALVPVCLVLVILWPLRLALHGEDLFRAGGGDSGSLNAAFELAEAALLAWSAALLVVGLATVRGWSLGRALAGASPCIAGLALLVVGLDVFD